MLFLSIGAVRVTFCAKALVVFALAHPTVIASCEIVARDARRRLRCVDEDDETKAAARDGVARREGRNRESGSKSSGEWSGNDVKMNETPLYERRRWKAPSLLDVKAGAALGEIESA